MNAKDRESVQLIRDRIEEARDYLDPFKEAEQEKYNNLPEGFREAEVGLKLEAIAYALEQAYDQLGEAVDSLGEALDK